MLKQPKVELVNSKTPQLRVLDVSTVSNSQKGSNSKKYKKMSSNFAMYFPLGVLTVKIFFFFGCC